MPAEGTLRDGADAGLRLIETMRWEPGAGLLRRDLHFARLGGSARELGFSLAPEEVNLRVAAALEGAMAAMRVRLALERDGKVTVEAKPFAPLAPGTVWRLRIAATRLSSSDPLLRHKTSRRDAYEAAWAEFSPHQADEVLLLNEKGELCEGTITSLFVETGYGLLATPPLACGLLAGVLRAELIGQGKAEARTLRPEDLGDAGRIFVGNSLRGLIEARLSPEGAA